MAEPTAEALAQCPICMTGLLASDQALGCPSCATRYHADCWTENRGCATYGCPEVPPTEGLRSLEVAPSYWGQENKACPSCGTSILAAAVRCRACGATFQSARPQASDDFHRHEDLSRRRPGLKRAVIVLFVLAVVPCTAVVGGVAGAVWYSIHKKDLEALPGVYPALARLGFVIGIAQTVIAVAAAGLYVALRK